MNFARARTQGPILDEFLRRFLLHILPQGFVRIRNFGFLANRRRATLLPLCFHLLGSAQQPQTEQNLSSTDAPSDLWYCPKCAGPMKVTRAAYRCRNPTALSTHSHRCSMKPLPSTRVLCVPRRGPHLSALPSDRSLLSASSTVFFIILFRHHRFHTPGVTRCTLALGRREPRRRTFPSLKFA